MRYGEWMRDAMRNARLATAPRTSSPYRKVKVKSNRKAVGRARMASPRRLGADGHSPLGRRFHGLLMASPRSYRRAGTPFAPAVRTALRATSSPLLATCCRKWFPRSRKSKTATFALASLAVFPLALARGYEGGARAALRLLGTRGKPPAL